MSGIKENLEQKSKEFEGRDDVFAMLLLTNPGYISSSRSIMFASHLKQIRTMLNPEVPKVFTNYENVIGDNSTGYNRSKHNYEVVDKIPKYTDDIDENHLYSLIVYDEKHDTYDIINKKIVENLTEKFGFSYNTECIDEKELGSSISKDEVLYRSTSYDEDMNYRYGINARVMYAIEPDTIEDAIVVSESFRDKMTSMDVETVTVTLNDNDLLLNLYGNSDRYKAFPDIGEYIKDGILCSKRRIHNSQVLFDLKKSNLMRINPSSDVCFYNTGEIIDIFIYCNKDLDDLPDTVQNVQIKRYLDMQEKYFRRIYKACDKIIKSGSKYGKDIGFYYNKAKDYLDENVKWKDKNNSSFNNMIMEFVITRPAHSSRGQKMTGRQGNKGVISKVKPDSEMPYDANGRRVDVILNTLGVINRLNTMQIIEQSMNFISECFVDHMNTLSSNSSKFNLIFDLVDRFNKDQSTEMKKYYKGLSKLQQKEYFEDINKYGVYLHMRPLWEGDEKLFDIISRTFKECEWVKAPQLYIDRFGRTIPIMREVIVGDLYMLMMKQTSKNQFSARSMGAINRRGVPDNSYKNKEHQDLYPTTALRIGYQENDMHNVGLKSKTINKFHKAYRSSMVDRQQLGVDLVEEIDVKDFKETNFPNRNVEILHAYMKSMGLELVYGGDKTHVDIDDGSMNSYEYSNKMYIGTKSDFDEYTLREDTLDKISYNGCFVGSTDEYDEFVEKSIEKERKDREAYYIKI